jgi:hypothetical protein
MKIYELQFNLKDLYVSVHQLWQNDSFRPIETTIAATEAFLYHDISYL